MVTYIYMKIYTAMMIYLRNFAVTADFGHFGQLNQNQSWISSTS